MPTPVPADTLFDVAIIKIGVTTWGATRGGIRRSPGAAIRPIPFDGRRAAHIVGLDRYIDLGDRIETTVLELGQTHIDRLINVSVSAPARPKAGELYTAARYLADVSFHHPRGGVTAPNGWVVVRYPWALVQWSELRGEDKSEVEVPIAIEPVQPAAGDLDAHPWTIEVHTSGAVAGWVTNGLLAMWHPNAGTGQVLEDTHGPYDGQLGSTAGADTNDPTWEASPPNLLYDIDDQVVATFVAPSAGGLSIELVVMMTVLPPGGQADGLANWTRDNETAEVAQLNVLSSGAVGFQIFPGIGPTSGATVISAGVRAHLLGTCDGTTGKIYINGVERGSAAMAHSVGAAPYRMHLGRRMIPAPNDHTSARLGTARAYNRALTPAEVTQNYVDRKTVYTDLP